MPTTKYKALKHSFVATINDNTKHVYDKNFKLIGRILTAEKQ